MDGSGPGNGSRERKDHRLTSDSKSRRFAALAVGIGGIVLYVIVGWLYLGSGLVVDYPWFVVLWAIWAGGVVVLIRVFRRSPFWTPLVALSAVAIWVVFVQLGSWLLGWSP